MLTPADVRRRSFGLLFLLLAVTLLVWGQTLLKPHLDGVAFVFYWLGCLLTVFITIGIAVWDMCVVSRRWLLRRRELRKRTLMEIELQRQSGQKPPSPPGQGL